MRALVIGGTAIIATIVTVPAGAADMARPVYKAPVAAPVTIYNWSGFYVGGNIGYAWADADLSWRHVSGADAPAAIVGREQVSTRGFNLDGFTGGAQIGINWQVGPWVFGIEADANYFNESGQSLAVPIPGFPGNSLTQTVSLDDLYTVRGRIGYAWDRTLFYVTGGWAGTNLDTVDSSVYPASSQFVAGGKFLSGWTLGAGMEWALGNNWSVKAEYLYADFGEFTTNSCNSVVPTLCYDHHHEVTMHVLRAGLNYKFDWGKRPVMAKY